MRDGGWSLVMLTFDKYLQGLIVRRTAVRMIWDNSRQVLKNTNYPVSFFVFSRDVQTIQIRIELDSIQSE